MRSSCSNRWMTRRSCSSSRCCRKSLLRRTSQGVECAPQMKLVFSFGEGKAEGDPTRRDLLGGKGAGLAEMTSLGLPVPPGFTISTDACRSFTHDEKIPDELGPARRRGARARREAARDALRRPEGAAARQRPLRRARVDARHDGHHPEPRPERRDDEGHRRAHRQPALRARRLPPLHRDVLGRRARREARALRGTRSTRRAARVGKDKGIDATRLNAEELRRKVPDADIPEAELEKVVARFKEIVKEKTGKDFPTDPEGAALGRDRGGLPARGTTTAPCVYRKMHDIPESWGTACNVQAMVFGNLGDTSATGVAFTRDPSTGERMLYGEWLPNAQGEDVVAGIRTPMPLRAAQSGRTTRSRSACPRPSRASSRSRATLEKHFRDMQDLEFTIQDGQALHAAVPLGEAHQQGRRAHRRRDGEGRAHHEGRGAAPRRAGVARPAAPPDARSRTRRRSCSRAASRRAPAPRRDASSSPPTKRSASRARATPSSSCASRRRPRTSTA